MGEIWELTKPGLTAAVPGRRRRLTAFLRGPPSSASRWVKGPTDFVSHMPQASGDQRVPSQDAYESQTADTNWIDLEDGEGAFHVREVAPLKLLRDMRRHGVAGLLGGDDDDVDMGEMLKSGDFDAFLEQTVLPNIVKPDCYWADVGDGDFDLAALTPNDLMVVITGMTGQDPDDLDEQMEDTFRG